VAPGTAKLGVKEVQKTCVAKKRPAQGQIQEAHGRLPLAGFNAVGQAESDGSIRKGDNHPTNWMSLSLGSPAQINPQLASE